MRPGAAAEGHSQGGGNLCEVVSNHMGPLLSLSSFLRNPTVKELESFFHVYLDTIPSQQLSQTAATARPRLVSEADTPGSLLVRNSWISCCWGQNLAGTELICKGFHN